MKPVYIEINKDGDKFYYSDKKMTRFHREDGPAIEWSDGSKHWWVNGLIHREDGPAVEYADGRKYWYVNGALHREDGPAIEYADGDTVWYLDGVYVSEAEHRRRTAKETVLTLDMIASKFGVDVSTLKIKR